MRLNPNNSADYRFRRCEDEGDGPWEECEQCGYPAPLAEFPHAGDTVLLCALCANTH